MLLALIYGPVVPYGVTEEQGSKCVGGLRDVWIAGEWSELCEVAEQTRHYKVGCYR